MSAHYAVWHIGLDGKHYEPGARLPELEDETWKRLAALGAIRTEFDPNPQMSADLTEESPEPENLEEEMPDIDAADGIVDDEEEMPKRKRTKKA